jgi:hypothetical protein
MLPRDRVEQILNLGEAGWSARAIADQLGHSPRTIRDYLNGRRTPGLRAPRSSLLTDHLADYCRQRLTEDLQLRPITLFNEVIELGFQGSRATFYRELARRQLSPPGHWQAPTQQNSPKYPANTSRPLVHTSKRPPVLPRPVAPVAGETLISYLTRLAHANHLTVTEVLAVLPSWFSTKINNRDDRAQHHTLAPATTEALHALAHLATTTPTSLARTLPAFGITDARSPVRATTACHRCAARRGIHQPVPVHLPIHDKVCTRHAIWLAHPDQPHLDLAGCPEIVTAQHRANRLLRRHTPQQLTLAHQAAIRAVPAWPASRAAIPHHWRHRLLTLQTTNHRRGIPTDHDAYMHAATYPEAITLAAEILSTGRFRTIEQDPLAQTPGSMPRNGFDRRPSLPLKIPHPRSEHPL